MAHSHDKTEVSTKRLVFTIFLNVAITVAQIIGGIVSGSLALISDAVHNLSDSISIVLAWLAQVLSRRPESGKSTFGYKRAEILAAFINAVTLIAISVFLVYKAVGRFLEPQQVESKWMFWLGLLGLVANGVSVWILERDKNKNLNFKAAYLHLLGDALTSLAVIIGAALIYFYKMYWIDPAVTILISIYLFVHARSILKESVTILMQMAPTEIHVPEIKQRLDQIAELENIHHIHLWNLTDKLVHFECHLSLTTDLRVSATEEIYKRVRNILHDEFGVEHVTIQFEFAGETKKDCSC